VTSTSSPTPTWEQLVDTAIAAGASDLHMHVDQDGNATVRARLDGVLVPWATLPARVVGPAVTRMKAAANLGTNAAVLIGEGRYRHHGPDGPVDLRLTVTPLVAGGSKVALRLPTVDVHGGLDELGFSPQNLARVRRLLALPDGLILATGPVGAGKSTTLLAALAEVGGPGRSVVTVEDPVERVVPGADQVEVREAAGLTYEHILRSLLRMDLDVLLVGEIRDRQTAVHAVQIAKAGRLVLSTLHSASAVGAVQRLHELSGLGALEVAESVQGVISQRLLRRVHADCAGAGCAGCLRTGFSGRIPVHQVLVVDAALREAMVRRAPATELDQVARSAGMRTFHEDATRWLAAGATTQDEVRRVLGHG